MPVPTHLAIPVLELVGLDGNAFSLMGAWTKAARRAKWPKEEIDRVIKDAMSGDYDHLLCVLSDNCESPPEGEDEE